MAFIRLAEQTGAIGALGQWVLETAIRQCKRLALDQYDGFFLSVNVSMAQWMDRDFAARVRDTLARCDYPAAKLTLEITEHAGPVTAGHAAQTMHALVAGGVRLALDDFGTGCPRYDEIRALPLHFVMTERSFIGGMEEDTCLQAFYRSVCTMAQAKGARVIAEGIETTAELDVTKANGADCFQGFLFARPMTADELSQRLSGFDTRSPALPQ